MWAVGIPITIALIILLSLGLWRFFRLFDWGNKAIDDERKRILEMVEAGKISAEEGTELLDTMGRSSALRGEEKFSRADFVMLVGVALVVLGFFLPWVYIGRGMCQVGSQVGAVGWAVFIIGVLSAVPVFVTPKNFLYKISMLQVFLTLIGLVVVINVLRRADDRLGAGLIFCLVGFIVEIIASGAKLKRLAA